MSDKRLIFLGLVGFLCSLNVNANGNSHNGSDPTGKPSPSPIEIETTRSCWGPDYPDNFINMPPQLTPLTVNLCLVVSLEPLDETRNHLNVIVTQNEEAMGAIHFSEWSPDSSEKLVCQSIDDCTVCLGFSDVFIDQEWASLAPKFISTCHDMEGKEMPEWITFIDTMYVGTDTDWIQEIVHGISEFAFDLFKTPELTQEENEDDEPVIKDLFVSPFAITSALMFPLMAANGQTYLQMVEGLGLSHVITEIREAKLDVNSELYSSYATLVEAMRHSDELVQSQIFNRLWISNAWINDLNPSVLNDFQRYGDIQPIHFRNESSSVLVSGQINDFIRSKSHDLITDGLQGKVFSSDTVLLFTNVDYFKMDWLDPFESVQNESFTDDEDKMEHLVTLMTHQNASVKYFATNMARISDGSNEHDSDNSQNDVEVIILPFKQEFSSFEFVLIRPTQEAYERSHEHGHTPYVSTIEIEESLDRETFKTWLKSAQPTHKPVVFPRFSTISNRQSIVPALKSLGMTDLFDANKCDLRNLTKEHFHVFENTMDRQESLTINEEGIEIGSLISDGTGTTEPDYGQIRHADRPFLFFIIDSHLDLILYSGRVTNPHGWCINECNSSDEIDSESRYLSKFFTSVFIILTVMGLGYLIIRWAYNVQVMRLQGSEAIPHIDGCRNCWEYLKMQWNSLIDRDDHSHRILKESHDVEDDDPNSILESSIPYRGMNEDEPRRDDVAL